MLHNNIKTNTKPKEIMTPQEFDSRLKELGGLYKEGKDCLFNLSVLESETKYRSRLFEIIRDMRDLAAVALKSDCESKLI